MLSTYAEQSDNNAGFFQSKTCDYLLPYNMLHLLVSGFFLILVRSDLNGYQAVGTSGCTELNKIGVILLGNI